MTVTVLPATVTVSVRLAACGFAATSSLTSSGTGAAGAIEGDPRNLACRGRCARAIRTDADFGALVLLTDADRSGDTKLHVGVGAGNGGGTGTVVVVVVVVQGRGRQRGGWWCRSTARGSSRSPHDRRRAAATPRPASGAVCRAAANARRTPASSTDAGRRRQTKRRSNLAQRFETLLRSRELSSALARRSRRQAYRGRTAPFELMAALPIEPAGLWGSVVRTAVARTRFVPPFVRTASRPSTFSTTFKGTCSKCVWAFCLALLVLTMDEEYQRRRATGHLLWDVDLSLSLLATDSNSGTCTV